MLTILLAAALSGMWDDETFLGRGVGAGAGISTAMGTHLAVEVEGGWTPLRRNAGYLEADSHALSALGRVVALGGGKDAAIRPFASAGLGVMRSTGTFTTSSFVPGPGGAPIPGPTTTHDWSTTRPMWEVSAGAQIGGSRRMSVRPEVRWSSTVGGARVSGALEPPLWNLRGGVTVAIQRW